MSEGRWRVASHQRERLVQGWDICSVPAGTLADPSQLADAGPLAWTAATQLGPVAAILRDHGLWSLDMALRRFDADDWWYRGHFDAPAVDENDDLVLGFDGLATLADVWLNGEVLLAGDNMFTAQERSVRDRLRTGRNELVLRFRSLDTALQPRRPRPNWRAPMVEHQQLRWFRTSLLGRTPGWSPPATVVGPWKDIWLERRALVDVRELRLSATVDAAVGRVDISGSIVPRKGVRIDAARLEVSRAGELHSCVVAHAADGQCLGRLNVPDASLWWPHTHGDPALYDGRLVIDIAGQAAPAAVDLGRIGFRAIDIDRSNGSFNVRVNGESIFCRGACWTPLDVVTLGSSPQGYRAALEQVRDAGMNMLRVSGSMAYEHDEFFDACDESGVLVWQDFMFANMDYPSDPAFIKSVKDEVLQQLSRWQGRPCLAVLCGNSEVEQQAAMWGASRDKWAPALFHEQIAQWAADVLPDVPYWPSSAHGGAFPYQASEGTTSYYGVGAYLRPLEDARRAELRFATECLAFANIPDASTLARMPGGETLRVMHPEWKSRTPRDLGAGWDFEDVRDHYLSLLYGVDATRLRSTEHDRYLELARSATGEAMAAAFAEWRRAASHCGGALVWFLRDLWAGAGWGLVDERGFPKAAFHHVRRVLAPIALTISDEGGNGLFVHAHNDGPEPLAASLRLAAYNESGPPVVQASRTLEIRAHGSESIAAASLFDGFHDFNAAYRFGPPIASVFVATLSSGDGSTMSEAFHFPAGLSCRQESDIGLVATVVGRQADTIELNVRTVGFAQTVHVELAGHAPDDDYFHLAPGASRTVRLRRVDESRRAAMGRVKALNSRHEVVFEVPA